MAILIPGARAEIVDGLGKPTVPFFRWVQDVTRAAEAGQISDAEAEAAIKAIAIALGSPDGTVENIPPQGSTFLLNGSSSIKVTGTPASGVVRIDLFDTGVEPGTYGDSTHIPVLTVDAKGRITSAQVVALSPSFVPYFVPDGTVFLVPLNAQALWTIPIELDGDAGLEIDGALVEVN